MRILLAVLIALATIPQASALITLDITDSVQNYSASQTLIGSIELVFSEYIPQESSMHATINGQPVSTVGMGTFVNPPSSYSFQKQSFHYNLTSEGKNTWKTYAPQPFNYIVTARGTCGGPWCDTPQNIESFCHEQCPSNCGPVYPCEWSATFSSQSSVDGSPITGLKHIYDATISIAEPGFTNNDTFWTVTNNNPNVITVGHAACAGQQYGGQTVWPTGWINREIPKNALISIPGTSNKEWVMSTEFRHDSLFSLLLYGGGPGGIYKDGQYQTFPNQAYWNGSNGTVILKNYDGNARYFVVYLPPNGPNVCAYTDVIQIGSQSWNKQITEQALVEFNSPYSRSYSQGFPPGLAPPECPQGTQECNKTIYSYNAFEIFDPKDSVEMVWDLGTNRVSAFTKSRNLLQSYKSTVPFSAFSGLTAPSARGKHELNLSIVHLGKVLGSGSQQFTTCQDLDKDGFCDAVDCDDSDPFINPNGVEICDGKDNDCDNKVDEDFWSAGSKIGQPCGIPNSVCAGIWVCTSNSQEVVCNSKFFPKEFPEYCEDQLDNDCDGVVDETVELVNGKKISACTCKDEDTRPCGNGAGACKQGIQTCGKGEWGVCTGESGPTAEICNGKDDNCDGVVDNVNNGNTVETSKCQCYGGRVSSQETCNEIDDNCNNQVDEGIACCEDQDTRSCGISIGVCTPGIQGCIGGMWGPCVGGQEPVKEACFNFKDDNCDGRVDENCKFLEQACTNGRQDSTEDGVDCGGPCPNGCEGPFFNILVVIGVVLFILIIGFVQWRSMKIPYERTKA